MTLKFDLQFRKHKGRGQLHAVSRPFQRAGQHGVGAWVVAPVNGPAALFQGLMHVGQFSVLAPVPKVMAVQQDVFPARAPGNERAGGSVAQGKRPAPEFSGPVRRAGHADNVSVLHRAPSFIYPYGPIISEHPEADNIIGLPGGFLSDTGAIVAGYGPTGGSGPLEVGLARAQFKVIFGDAQVYLAVKSQSGAGRNPAVFQAEHKFLLVHGRGGQERRVHAPEEPIRRRTLDGHDLFPRFGGMGHALIAP